jgi:hypothetical protein
LSRLLAGRGLDVTRLSERLGQLGEGQALTWGLMPSPADTLTLFQFGSGPRTFPAVRRLHQYLEERIAPSRQFYFHDLTGQIAPAGNLDELIDRLRTLDLSVLTFHFQRGDYGRWIRDVLHDKTLARWIDRLHTTDLSGEALRLALLDDLERRHRMLGRLTQPVG